ncbi:xylulokinase [Jatrophihabitans endophyticus]|uniref:Xylulose kinase n=1 Tax=Jatrophihabitans endophyticus TaxID=1206085 RepID=A0A1M5E3C2_9ACTN|nr:xylulokinase [Jatrophihabitans endophyticus]SHF73644.1 xylulokinase [Jatrophihabitans endophyticus]
MSPPTSPRLVAGVDSSTQSCKVVVHDADTGAVVRHGSARHPDGTAVHPDRWWDALQEAAAAAGGLDDVAALAVGGQQHGMVCLDDAGEVVRDALLWNDTRSAAAADALVAELPGGAAGWAEAVGTVPVGAITATKLRWLAEHEPANADRVAAVCLPHDWLTWRLLGSGALDDLVTDRGDASGTGYWSTPRGEYRTDLLELAFGRAPHVPRVLAPDGTAGTTPGGALLGAGTGDNAGAAIGLGAAAGDVVVSIGTSGVVSAVSDRPTADPSGIVAGFADATGRYLPLACTLNAARVLSSVARMLGVELGALADLALAAPSGADGLVLVPYLEGERTPNRPDSAAAVHGLELGNTTPSHLARAAVEGLLCGLADGLDALVEQGSEVRRVLLVGGGAQSVAVRRIAPALLGAPVTVPEPAEYVARGAARQAAWVLAGDDAPPEWTRAGDATFEAEAAPSVRSRYAEVRDLTARRLGD